MTKTFLPKNPGSFNIFFVIFGDEDTYTLKHYESRDFVHRPDRGNSSCRFRNSHQLNAKMYLDMDIRNFLGPSKNSFLIKKSFLI